MTKTPMVQRFALWAKFQRPAKAALTEPFLSSSDGKLHTTGRLERSNMRRRWLVLACALGARTDRRTARCALCGGATPRRSLSQQQSADRLFASRRSG